MARVLQQQPSGLRGPGHERIASSAGEKKEIWSTLLNSVASGKRIPEKRLLVLGGTQDSQRELIDSLAVEPPTQPRRGDKSKTRKTPMANRFALGYTYKDIYDAEGEDVLARLSIYTLPTPSPSYAPLLTRLLTSSTIPHTAITILLDWSQPWTFIPLLRSWIRLLNAVLSSLPAECQHALEDNNTRWLRRRDPTSSTASSDATESALPLGPGEFDTPLGLPIAMVVQNAQDVERLEKESGYKEADFDFALQFLRTVLLGHGAGLLYTMSGRPGVVKGMLLGTLLEIGEKEGTWDGGGGRGRREVGLKHNVVDRERVVVPPGWDSWGKIRVLREGFDIEGVARAWGSEVQEKPEEEGREDGTAASEKDAAGENGTTEVVDEVSTVKMYAARISNPKVEDKSAPAIEVEHTDDQVFLSAQLERLEAFRVEDEAAKKQRSQTRRTAGVEDNGDRTAMNEQIGAVQFNVGGIQYDADEALKRIRDRTKGTSQQQSTPDRPRTRESTPFTPGSPPSFESGKDVPVESLEAYFASLVKGGRGSVQNSPRLGTGSPRVVQKPSGEQGSRSGSAS